MTQRWRETVRQAANEPPRGHVRGGRLVEQIARPSRWRLPIRIRASSLAAPMAAEAIRPPAAGGVERPGSRGLGPFPKAPVGGDPETPLRAGADSRYQNLDGRAFCCPGLLTAGE